MRCNRIVRFRRRRSHLHRTGWTWQTPKGPAQFRNIHGLLQIVAITAAVAGIVSILHRVSGVLMFLLLPFIIWMFDTSVTSRDLV